jgi:hypothetical protein
MHKHYGFRSHLGLVLPWRILIVSCGVLLVGVAQVGCGDSSNPEFSLMPTADGREIDHGPLSPVKVASHEVAESVLFSRLGPMAIDGGVLWVVDRKGDPFLHEVSIDRSVVVRSIGRAGEGPGEFRSIGSVQIDGVGRLWLYDNILKRLTIVDPSIPSWSQAVFLSWDQLVGTLTLASRPIGRNRVLVKTADPGRPYLVVDTSGTVVREFSVPGLGPASVSGSSGLEALLQSNACVSGDGETVVVGYLNAPRVDVISVASGSVSHADVPFNHQGTTRANPRGREVLDASRLYYQSCTVIDGHIIALFSGRQVEAFEEGEGALSSYLHVFDLTGKFAGALSLDRPMSSIVSTSEGSMVVGSSAVTGELWHFSLPSNILRSVQ